VSRDVGPSDHRRVGRFVALLSAIALGLLARPPSAHADAKEASLHVHAVGGAARLGEDDADAPATVALAGVAARFTYAFSHHLAWEATTAFETGTAAQYDDYPNPDGTGFIGTLTRTTRLARLELGDTARLGVRYIPTIHLGVGVVTRFRGAASFTLQGGTDDDALPSDIKLDLVAVGGLGFDYRINRRWIAGISAEARHAVPLGGPSFDSVEGFLHLAYYWYPRW
jgi:hypothetical protein